MMMWWPSNLRVRRHKLYRAPLFIRIQDNDWWPLDVHTCFRLIRVPLNRKMRQLLRQKEAAVLPGHVLDFEYWLHAQCYQVDTTFNTL